MTSHLLLLPSGVASAVLASSAAELFAPSLVSGVEREALSSIAWLVVPLASWIVLSKWVSLQIAGFLLLLSFAFISRKRHPFLSKHLKEALSFQFSIALLTVLIAIGCAIALFWKTSSDTTSPYVGLILALTIALPLLTLLQLVTAISAAFKAAQGKPYRYPLSWRLWT
jgi:uncharacterized Tic20 family protein